MSTPLKLGKWVDLEECGYILDSGRTCHSKITHVVFINLPSEEMWPYAVGACAKHRRHNGDWHFVTLGRFERTVRRLLKRVQSRLLQVFESAP